MLVVLSKADPVKDTRGHTVQMYNCRCDCGTEKAFRYNNLMTGMTNSCGCSHFSKLPPADLTGRQFGKLRVLYEAEPHYEKCGKRIRCWACVCDCGNETNVLQSNLLSPHGTRSCGCLGKDQWASMGRRPKNLTGNRYGRLTVVGPAEPDTRSNGFLRQRWVCRCDCGNEKIVSGDNLQAGHTRSCGCLKRTGLKKKQFGALTVIGKPIKDERLWTCRCVCGNEIVVDQDDLFWDSVTSCGCQRKGITKIDLKGRRFGMLTVVRETEPIAGSNGKPVRRWLCRCECGREAVVRQGNLLNKVTRSCGCLRAKKQKQKNRQKDGMR